MILRRPSRFWVLIGMPTVLVLFGTFGYPFVEPQYTVFDGLYMTLITLTTIGYGEVHELSTNGRIFTLILILSGVFGFIYSASEMIRIVVSGELVEIYGKRQMEKALAVIKDHIIVCGFGRMGHLVCKEFSRLGRAFVVIDYSEAALKDFDLPHGIPLPGDATSDEVLRKAGVERASYLVTVMASDADNLFTTMSAHLLRPDLMIVARVEDMASEQKLMKAGAGRVVSPYQIGGARVAHAVVKPTVVDFIELTTRSEHIELQLEEAKIEPNSTLVGRNLREARLRAEHQVIIVALKKKTGHMVFNPPADTTLEAGDILVAIGSPDHLAALDQLAKPKPA